MPLKKMCVDSVDGIECPWCPHSRYGRKPIANCPHNPFKLMAENERLRDELSNLRQAQENVRDFVDAFKRLL